MSDSRVRIATVIIKDAFSVHANDELKDGMVQALQDSRASLRYLIEANLNLRRSGYCNLGAYDIASILDRQNKVAVWAMTNLNDGSKHTCDD